MEDGMSDNSDLEKHIDEGIRRSGDIGYYPERFVQMRRHLGTKGAMERLVTSGDIQTGFQKLVDAGMPEWTMEAAVIKFPALFGKNVHAAAQWRLDQAKKSA
jgi:hypothetical protein